MRELLEFFNIEQNKYVFDGNSQKIFKVTDENKLAEYKSQSDDVVVEKQMVSKGKISKIVLNMSNKCNLRCKYCYADGGQYASKKNAIMSSKTLKEIVKELIDKEIKSISVISFFGGEPLLNYSLIKEGITLFEKNFQVGNYEIVTNAWYLNEEIIFFLKQHNVKLSISIDGPQDVTDALRGEGCHKKVMEAIAIAKKINYTSLECSATYTKYHEEFGYSYEDINQYFEELEVKATISRVISNDKEIIPEHNPTEKDLKEDIEKSVEKIYKNDQTGGINPYLYRTLMSLAFGSKSINFCDDLMSDFSIAYDYDGTKYNCFHFWGEKQYSLKKDEMCNEIVREANCKNSNKICASCWAKYFCKICTASLLQNTMELPFINNGECKDKNIYRWCLEFIIKYHKEEKLETLIDNFVSNFVYYA